MTDLIAVSEKFKEKLLNIKVFLSDVDGILTNGQLYYSGQEVGYNRFFHAHDGYGFKILQNAGLKVGIITGGNSLGVKKRFEDLGLDFIYMGDENKTHAYKDILNQGFKDHEILYMGDEFFDIPILKQCGFSATVDSASLEVQEAVDYITKRPAGMGCVREVIDILRFAQKISPKIDEM